METINVLKLARSKIKNAKFWCQGHYFVEVPGEPKAYCAIGALQEATSNNEEFTEALFFLAKDPEITDGVAKFNDTHTHDEVLALFNRRIAALEEK